MLKKVNNNIFSHDSVSVQFNILGAFFIALDPFCRNRIILWGTVCWLQCKM